MKHIVWGRRVIKGILVILLCLQAEILVAETSGVYISEFMAINSKILADEDGDYPDWIELFNAGDQPVDLTGWFLTDNPDNLEKWKIPALVLDAGAYRILFASEKKRNDPARNLHTNFKLSGSGEYLALVASDGKTVAHAYGDRYPAQREDVSYGLYQDQAVFFSTPTPGSANVLGTIPFAPVFSHTRGFYSEKIDVGLTSPGNGGTIYYTLDGKIPGPQTGTRYTSPIPIQQTTPLSAVAVDPGGALSEVITHTYWFLGDIVAQPESPDGYPMDWKMASASTSIPADYEMDPEICNAPEYRDLMEGALTDLPSMSLVTNKEYLFNPAFDSEKGGIYIYTGKPSSDGVDWVRPTSIEYFDPATGDEFQVNCRLKLHGGNSRNPSNSPKHGFELTFRSEYGPSKLNFHLFDEKGATNEFNNLVLRAGYNYSWVKNNETQRLNAQNLQDPWAKNTQLDMGKTSAHERFVHLYINGLYWGVYNLSEKYTNDFFESYMKGSEDDFDIIKEKQVVSAGNISAYNALIAQMNSGLSSNANYQKIQGNNPDGTLNPAYANLLDMNNYIDYMLINYYVGNLDWNKNNWVMARNRVLNEAGFRFLCWDVETAMTDLSIDLVSEEGDSKTPMSFIKYLKG
ncbi:MAG TPA: chitobiase/beta-hexosaminidase C-terminal domain-containing protein, partial [Prolixibacteraceae bacterium]|nr:chitobiase/beta-hexosaminidase C-terminal domain-containing protein [Prolixibacteraceae bacterium]